MTGKMCAYSSHIPALIAALQATRGDVLELGTGHASTPVLHWLCGVMRRRLLSLEGDRRWFDGFAVQFETDTHDVRLVEDWDRIAIERPWSVALVDHPDERRAIEVERLAPYAQIIVVHDTDWYFEKKCHYKARGTFERFRYVAQTTWKNHSTILSNSIDVRSWFADTPRGLR